MDQSPVILNKLKFYFTTLVYIFIKSIFFSYLVPFIRTIRVILLSAGSFCLSVPAKMNVLRMTRRVLYIYARKRYFPVWKSQEGKCE
jgi:hypothetical protein